MPHPVGLSQFVQNLFCLNIIQRGGFYAGNFVKNSFTIGLHSDV